MSMPLLIHDDRTDSVKYTGPLEAGKRLAAEDAYGDLTVTRLVSGKWEVADSNSFGIADTLEDAWRFYLGAEFGPIDEEYDSENLQRELDRVS